MTVELAWMAGLFEGEGSVRINCRTKRNRAFLRAEIVNVDESLVAPFNDRWPGWFRKIEGKGNRRDHWRWVVATVKAAVFLAEIEPFVRSQRMKDRIALALEFQGQKSTDAAVNHTAEYIALQEDFFDRMTALNRRGREAES